ncbi:hypothetical protein GLYMA_08G366600v4 [Glycine max]|uniref:DUF4378 domain-containing protein n=1 Tax=Glycine max TaxID=3847 RepID=A0A0R0IXC0_SOYBN|nr:uncharacterized protein LOC100809045 isoform X2 [Glycine max]KAH1054842.1 hypothetical protein GYH30_023556 [Glycine max]KRH46941.1 hypothetical protein GLYMA_08G366600v4 [Glycine max]|eukprot:XP_006586292.1 uncharacterized protein LOC100809045 isoform X2 [Glycine max]
MNDSSVKNLAITEKKVQQHKPGGCVGIFFQLIDWKRKLSKKKLFSKKLLPPARAKKFKGDEKMPNSKLHLIANENSGGFPSAKKGGNHGVDGEQKSDLRVPSLVARLMGLESIPAAQRDKSKKAVLADVCADGKKESSADHGELDRQGVDLEMGVVKHDSRPQKLQKTGVYERRAVTRFGAEALQIKSVLSRARKYNHHHPKLASSLKSPRVPSGKSASRSARLIGAATKILEPGLQSRSRAKNSLTYPASLYPHKTGIVSNGVEDGSAIMQNQSCYKTSPCKQLMGQTSCKNCGNLLDVVDCKLEVGGQPLVPPPIVSDVITATSMEKKGKSFPPHGHERDVVLPISQEKLISLVTEAKGKNNAHQSWSEPTARRMPMPHDGPAKWNSSCLSSRTLEDDASSFALKHKTQTQEQMLSSERYSSGSTTSDMQVKRVLSSMSAVNGTKDFVAMNRSLSGRSRMRSPTKADSSKFDLEKKPYNRQQSSLSHGRTLERKRRIPNVTQLEGAGSVYSVDAKQRNLHSGGMGGKIRDFNASSLNNSIVKNKQVGQGERFIKVNDNKINVVSFNPPLKQKIGIHGKREETSSDNESMRYFRRPSPLRVDALGAFLEQKLKELTSQRDEELATGAPPKKSSAMILQELISALSSENLICHDDHHMFNENYGAKQERLLGTSCNGNHLSPGSVLEASFSSSSLDESSGHGFHPDSMNYSYYGQLEHDTELSDSATSFKKGSTGEMLSDLINQIPRALESLLTLGTELTRSKLGHMKDILLHAELVLGIATDRREDEGPQLLIYRFLGDDLDSMASDAMWTDANGVVVGCEDSKQRKELKGFLLDCVIEYLESNCCQYFNSGSKAWTKLPLCMKAEMLAQEVKREINEWLSMVGMVPDEIIEWEMSHSLGKWTDFDIEAFEAGVDIDGDILQILVDEVVQDLAGCKQGTISF